jgi:hypothetical protein
MSTLLSHNSTSTLHHRAKIMAKRDTARGERRVNAMSEKRPSENDPSGADSGKNLNTAWQVVVGLALAGWAIGGDQGWWWFPRLVETKKLNFAIVLIPIMLIIAGVVALFKGLFGGKDRD